MQGHDIVQRAATLFLHILVWGVLAGSNSYGQQFDTLRIASYNVLNYPGSTSSLRNPEFRKVMHGLQPDLLVVQEMTTAAGIAEFRDQVLNNVAPGLFTYIPFNDGPDTDNGLFFRNDKWEVLGASYLPTGLRDIAEYIVRPLSSSEVLRIYSLHLKASTGTANEQQRLAEATILRDHLNTLPAGTYFIVVGDYNIYSSNEPAWQKLLASEANDNGRCFDPLNLNGTWNSPVFAQYHTQSPRIRSFGGGATGGLDDRFDIILTSASMAANILVSTYQAYGNDGNHYNDSINRLPNASVPDSIANALHNASDHLPVTARFIFTINPVPVQLASFTGAVNATGDSIVLRWRTLSETNNYGFEVQRRTAAEFVSVPNGFVAGHGTTLEPQSYRFSEPRPVVHGLLAYRLKQVDLDGTIHYTESIQVNTATSVSQLLPFGHSLLQNHPNPFNPTTQIAFSVVNTTDATLAVFDVVGREVATLFNGTALAGVEYAVNFDAHSASKVPLASGVYFYRLTVKNSPADSRAVTTKRMVLLK